MGAKPLIGYCTLVNWDYSATRMSWAYGSIVGVNEHLPSLPFQNQDTSTWNSRWNFHSTDHKFWLLRPNYRWNLSFHTIGPVLSMFMDFLIPPGTQGHHPYHLASPERPFTVKVSGGECQNFRQFRNRVQRSRFSTRIPRGNVVPVEYDRGEILSWQHKRFVRSAHSSCGAISNFRCTIKINGFI